MKGFGIEIKNELLDPIHVDKMGVSVWLYFWFLDKMTSISEEGVGLVLGGKPIIYAEVQAEMGITESTYGRWVSILKRGKYINITRTPHGLRVSVNKAFKRFGKHTNNSPAIACEWCGRKDLALANHHYPIHKTDGGTETVLICVVCHAIYHSTNLPPDNDIYKRSPKMTYHSFVKNEDQKTKNDVSTSENEGSPSIQLQRHNNKTADIKKIILDPKLLKQKFWENPLFEKIKEKYPDRDYEFYFEEMCQWYLQKKGSLPIMITAFTKWLSGTKPDELLQAERRRQIEKEALERKQQILAETPRASEEKMQQMRDKMKTLIKPI